MVYFQKHTYEQKKTLTHIHIPLVAAVADELLFPVYFLKGSRGERVGLKTLDPIRSGRTAICQHREEELNMKKKKLGEQRGTKWS